MTEPRSTLAPFAALFNEADDMHARIAAKQAWQNAGLILINPKWLSGWAERKQAEQMAEKLHGRRK